MKKFLLTLLILILLAGAAAGGWYVWELRRLTDFVSSPHGTAGAVTVLVPGGSGPKTVAKLLSDGGAVADPELFYKYIRQEKAGPKLKAGEYEFKTPITPAEVLAML